MGSVDNPITPSCIAIGCEANFVARAVDVDIKHLTMVLQRAAAHMGTSFVEVYQDCNVFNSGAFLYATDKKVKAEHSCTERELSDKLLRTYLNAKIDMAFFCHVARRVIDRRQTSARTRVGGAQAR